MAETSPSPPTAPPNPAPSVFPDRGFAGFIGALVAGGMAGAMAWGALVHGQNYPVLLGFMLAVPLPLFFAGLGIGRGDALLAAVVALGAMAWLIAPPIMMLLAAIYVLPTLLLCLLALRHRQDEQSGTIYWYPAGRLMTFLTLYPLTLLAIAAVVFAEPGLEKMLHDMLLPVTETMLKMPEVTATLPASSAAGMAEQMTGMMTALLPGMMVLGWMVVTLSGALWTQFALLSNKTALRPMPKLDEYELPPWLLILFAIMILLALFFDGAVAYFARNTLLPLVVPYFVLGTSLVHFWAGRRKHKILYLALYYLLVTTIVYPIFFVALAGVLEPWLHLRQRLNGKTQRNA